MDPDPTYQFYANPCGSGLATLTSTTLGKETELRVTGPRVWTANKNLKQSPPHLYSLVLGSAEEQILRGEDGQHRPVVSLRHIAADQRTLAANSPLVRVNYALVGALPLPDICAGDEAGEDVFSRRRRGFFA